MIEEGASMIFLFVLGIISSVEGAILTDFNEDGPQVVLFDATVDTPLMTEFNDGKSEENAIQVYVPMGTESNKNFFIGPLLPQTLSSVTATGSLEFHLSIDVEGEEELYLHTLLKSATGEVEVFPPSVPLSADRDSYKVAVSLNQLCSGPLDCTPFHESSVMRDRDVSILFLLSDTEHLPNGLNEADYEVKLWYKATVSNRIETDREILLKNIFKGDKRLFLDYEGFDFASMDSVYAYVIENPSSHCAIGDAEGSIPYSERHSKGYLVDLERMETEHSAAPLKGLENGHCHAVRVGFVNKFGFASKFSRRLTSTPERIEVLLDKQACFLLTAGWGREHPVVDFFRHFRDKVLRIFPMGRFLIDIYGQISPRLAPFILKDEALAKKIRGLSFGLYLFLRYGWVVLLGLAAGFVLVKFSRGLLHGRA